MVTKTSRQSIGDLIKAEWDHRYSRATSVYANGSGSPIVIPDPVGYPIALSGLDVLAIVAGNESATNALLLDPTPINLPDSESINEPIPVLRRGPAVVNKDTIISTDIAGDPLDVDAIVAALATLSPPITILTEPSKTSTQTP